MLDFPNLTPEKIALLLPFAAGFICALLLISLVGRAPVALFTPVVKLIRAPFRAVAYLLRLARLLPRTRTPRNVAVGAATAIDHGDTEIETALRQIDNPAAGPDGAVYDFKVEKALLKHDGWFFRSITVPAEYFPASLTSTLSEDVAQDYLLDAQKFFSQRVALSANQRALYEDAEGAAVIALFRSHDRRCYYVLNQIRKTINDNARRLVVGYSIILAGAVYGLNRLLTVKPFDTLAENLIAGAGLSGIVAIVMVLMHVAGYQKQQQQIARELRSFLTRYLGRISDRYREATAMARGVTVGEEKNSKKLAEGARKWHKIMMWMPFRSFFIETFVRNIRFQIDRNCSYYLLIPPLVLIAGAGMLASAYSSGYFAIAESVSVLASVLVTLTAALVFVYLKLIYKTVIANEVNQIEWLGFDNLNISQAMDDVVGKYAEEVGYWKNRYER